MAEQAGMAGMEARQAGRTRSWYGHSMEAAKPAEEEKCSNFASTPGKAELRPFLCPVLCQTRPAPVEPAIGVATAIDRASSPAYLGRHVTPRSRTVVALTPDAPFDQILRLQAIRSRIKGCPQLRFSRCQSASSTAD